jgi:hypothetical protein
MTSQLTVSNIIKSLGQFLLEDWRGVQEFQVHKLISLSNSYANLNYILFPLLSILIHMWEVSLNINRGMCIENHLRHVTHK